MVHQFFFTIFFFVYHSHFFIKYKKTSTETEQIKKGFLEKGFVCMWREK